MPELKKEQRQAVFHDQGNILVSASAGSGKTFVMIERAIRLITEGKASVKEILAVTFTELAATEMKEKLKKALFEKISKTKDLTLAKELSEVATSDICTLHAFCGRLIRTYFYAIGVNPDFKILDEGEATALKKDSIDKVFKDCYQQKEEWFIKLCKRHFVKRTDEEFKSTILQLRDYCYINAETDLYLQKCEQFYTEEGFSDLLSEFKISLNQKIGKLISVAKDCSYLFNKENKQQLKEFADGLIEDMGEFLLEEDVYALKRFVGYKRDLPKGRKHSEEVANTINVISSVREAFKEIIEQATTGFNDRNSDVSTLSELKEHTRGLFRLINLYNERYAELKKEENALDFSDLEHCALKILKDEKIRSEVRARYKFAFVDEYQDVNGVQEEILSAVTNDNLFMVGDAKQSIYGFRGCRPEIFSKKLKGMTEANQSTVILNHNFRSCDKVIETVNKIFGFSMTKEFYGISYKESSELCAGGVYPKDKEGRAELHLLKTPAREKRQYEQPRLYNILNELKKDEQTKTQPVASLIAELIFSECEKEFYDPKLKTMRPIKFGDIAILTRNKENKFVKDIVKGLNSYGIPVVSVVKENVLDYPEIASLINVLKLIDCFNQDVPLASTLKSAVGKFTDEELAEIVVTYNQTEERGSFYQAFNYFIAHGEGELREKAQRFKEYISKIRLVADFVGAHGILKRIIRENDIEQTLLAMDDGVAKLKRLRRFVSASKTEDKSLSVKEFIKRISDFPGAFGLSEQSSENSVKLMTIHASKGLEFPVVIVCGLERNANSREEREEIMFDHDLGFAVKSYNDLDKTMKETPLRAIFRSKMKENRIKEELRLFYVALTRATYSLHLTVMAGKDQRKNFFCGAKRFLDYVPLDMPITLHEYEDLIVNAKPIQTKKVLIGSPNEESVEQMNKNFAFIYPFLEETNLRLKTSVTKANKLLTEENYPVKVLYSEEKTDDEKGNIAHKIMEHLDFSNLNEFDFQLEEMLNSNLLTKEEISKVNLDRIKNALSCPIFSQLKGYKLFAEKDFMVNVGANEVFDTSTKEPVILQGIIDLLAIKQNDGIIIDYKYSALSKEGLEKRYKKQLQLYKYAVETSLNVKVSKTVLVNIFTGGYVFIDF